MSVRVAVMIRTLEPAWRIFAWVEAGTLSAAYTAADVVWRNEIRGRGITSWSYAATAEEAARMLADPSYDPDAKAGPPKGKPPGKPKGEP